MSSSPIVIPKEISDLNTMEDKLRLIQEIGRSFSIYRIDCGSCNGCEIEIFASITPMWDPERFGFKLVASPRHADILLCTGPVTRHMYYPLLRAYEAAPDPKIVIGYGACGSTGGIFHDCYSTWGGVDQVIPVDVWIPGCPPHPASTIYGIAIALGILDQRLKHQEHIGDTGDAPMVTSSLLGDTLFEREVQEKAKRLMGYLHGRILYKEYIDAMVKVKDPFHPISIKDAIKEAVAKEEDPRFRECLMILHNEVYLKHIKRFLNVNRHDPEICFLPAELEAAYD